MSRSMRTLTLVLAILALVLAAPAFAGGKDCQHPAKDTKATKAQMMEKAKMIKHAGWTGIEAERDSHGILVVTAVHPDSPAAQADLRAGDRLVAYQGIEISKKNHEALKKAKKARHVGAEVTYTIERAGQRHDIALTIAEVPDAVLAEMLGERQGEAVASID